jgi:hypothetical protein
MPAVGGLFNYIGRAIGVIEPIRSPTTNTTDRAALDTKTFESWLFYRIVFVLIVRFEYCVLTYHIIIM